MKSLCRLLLIVPALMASAALAGTSTGAVTTLMTYRADLVLFAAGTHADKPSCSTLGNEWALSLSTVGGKAIYAALLAAQAQGKAVQVLGTGACGDWPDRETPMAIVLQ
jgi:hypothetical protein